MGTIKHAPCLAESHPLPLRAAPVTSEPGQGWYLVRSEAALLLLLLLDSESELLRGRLQSLRYTRKLFFTGWFPLLKPLAGRSAKHPTRRALQPRGTPPRTPGGATGTRLCRGSYHTHPWEHLQWTYHCHCPSWSWGVGFALASSAAGRTPLLGAEGGRWGCSRAPE